MIPCVGLLYPMPPPSDTAQRESFMPQKPAYVIQGGNPVRGEITCMGAKNFVTKAMVASLLGETPSALTNVPAIGDVDITAELLRSVGMTVGSEASDHLTLDPRTVNSSRVVMPEVGSNRIPILMVAPLLHHFDEVTVPEMGGCNIGARNLDFHLNAIRALGGEADQTREGIVARKKGRLQGTQIHLPYPSVGATETALFLGVLAEGCTVIENAAIEPEVMELITLLRAMGAIIFTRSGRSIRIEGVPRLRGTNMYVLGDRIEAGSWAALAVASKGDITVHGIRPETLGNFFAYLRQVGGGFEYVAPQSIRFFRETDLRPAVIETDVYPGFSTDWQQPFGILLTQANGVSTIHETVYENRFGYLTTLQEHGARVQLSTHCLGTVGCRFKDTNHEHSAIILGPTPLSAIERIEIPDLRAGLAYVIAAAIAEGTSTITGIPFLERGYGDIVPRLQRMDLPIERTEIPE